MSASVAALYTYPVKSCRAITQEFATVTWRGLEGDREWMLVTPDGRFITQRDKGCGMLARVRSRRTAIGGLLIEADGMPTLFAANPAREPGEPKTIDAVIWRDTVRTLDAGDNAATWFTRFLGFDCRLVYMPETAPRQVDQAYAGPADHVRLADGFPVLIANEASLDALGLPHGMMGRFRPNIVLKGLKPFEEDTISVLQVGGAMFNLVKPCARCPMPGIDQLTGVYNRESNPLPALHAGRRNPETKMSYFGQNAIPSILADIAMGDAVQVIARHAPHAWVANLPVSCRMG